MKIEHNDKIVSMISASAMGKADAEEKKTINEFAAELMANPTPENRYHMAQMIQFAVENIILERTDYLNQIADFKQIGDNDRAMFDAEYDNSFAVIQADNASTPMWMPGGKSVDVDTVEVSSRFAVSMYDIRSGKADIGKLANRAAMRIEEKIVGLALAALDGAYNGTQITSPFYGSGSGVVTNTLDPMITYLRRFGNVNLLGDIEIIDKLTQANGAGWVSDNMRDEYNQFGFIGRYKGSPAYVIANGYYQDGTTPVVPVKKLFLVPNGLVSPLKVVRRGTVLGVEEQHADTAMFEMSLRQRAGAAVVYGNHPGMGVYVDTSV